MNYTSFISCVLTMIEVELRRLRHDPIEVFTRAIQPVLWVTIFGSVMAKIRAFPSVGDYVTFIAPGVIMQSATFIALAYGIMLIFEREAGLLKRLLTVPISRAAIVLGRSLAGGIRASTQYIVVLIAAIIAGAKIDLNPLGLIIGWLMTIYVAMGFTGLSIFVASTLKTRERFMGIVGAISMPLFFASNALYPVDIMPGFIKIIAPGNPLTYTVNILRKILIYDNYNILVDLAALTAFNALSITVAFRCFSKIVE